MRIHDAAYKIMHSAKTLCIISDKVHEYTRKYDRTKFLGLLHSGKKYETIFD